MGKDEKQLSTGIPDIDQLIGGLRQGDNVVLEMNSGAPVDVLMEGIFRASRDLSRPLIYISFNRSPHALLSRYENDLPDEFYLLDCFTGGKGSDDSVFSDFYDGQEEDQQAARIRRCMDPDPDHITTALEQCEEEAGPNPFYIFDSITGMLELWNTEREVLNFFAHMCPRLYDLNTVAYWILETEAHTDQFLANLRHITQVVLELTVQDGNPAIVVRKCEGRSDSSIGIPQHFALSDEGIEFAPARREELEMALLSEISETIGKALELEKVFEQTMDILARELELKRGTLVLRERGSNKLKIVAAHALSEEEKDRGTYEVGEGVTGRVVETGQPISIPDISKDPFFLNRTGARKRAKGDRPISFVCVPLVDDNEVVGAISVDREFVDEETLAKDQRLLQIIAGLVSQAIKINRMVMLQREELVAENLRLRKDLQSKYKFGNIVAASGAMQDVVATASTVAASNANVLIRGETGTGKELVAGVLHYNSERSDGPFVKVNCGALSENLLESELFGHVKGAFTGAIEDRKGRFELADGGTIFLDEIGTISEMLQVKLLRVLQEKEFERVGGAKTHRVDVRIVAATNEDLEKLMKEGRFREDLFYRLNVIPIQIPPLRDRTDDIPFLVDHFLEKYNEQYDKEVSQISREVLDTFMHYPWPGNVRELESCIERAVVLSQSGTIGMNLLPINMRSMGNEQQAGAVGEPEEVISRLVQSLRKSGTRHNLHERIMQRVEKALLKQVLESNDFVQTRAADELGMSRNTVRRKIKDLGIKEND
ncbi:MAG: sigma 54-interacting transcriptional regulator [Planctomycetota bacterium]